MKVFSLSNSKHKKVTKENEANLDETEAALCEMKHSENRASSTPFVSTASLRLRNFCIVCEIPDKGANSVIYTYIMNELLKRYIFARKELSRPTIFRAKNEYRHETFLFNSSRLL